jgi:sugar phosphate isomerase/epimerase
MNIRTSRRGFLGGSIALAGLPAAATFNAFAAEAGDEFKIGVATYSLRKFPRPAAIEMLKKLNVKYLSIKEFHLRYVETSEQTAAGAKEFRDAGMTILSGGNIDLKKPEDLKKMFEYAKAAGMPMMVCAPSHETLPAVEKLVKEYNIKCALHNHGPEDKHFPTPKSVLDAVKHMDPRMGLCMDIGHSARTGADIVAEVKNAGSRMLDLHIKDLTKIDTKAGKAVQVAVGDGDLPIVTLFKALRQAKYKGGVMLEYEINADDPYPGMERSLSYERGVLAGLRG